MREKPTPLFFELMPKLLACLFILIFFSFFHQPVFAASINVSNVPTSLIEEQEFTVTVNVAGAAANTINYLRAAFYSETSPTSYFGYTFNHLGSWYNGTPSPIDPHQFLQIQIGTDGYWSGELKAKADIASSAFKGSGSYYFKIGRYTASGSSVSDWSEATSITISAPSPTPTPTPTSTPSPTSSASQSSSSTKSPTPTPKPSAAVAKSTPSPTNSAVLGSKTEEQLLLSSTPEASPTQSAESEQKGSSKTKIAAMLTGSGVILIGLSIGFFVLYNKTLNKSDSEERNKNKNGQNI